MRDTVKGATFRGYGDRDSGNVISTFVATGVAASTDGLIVEVQNVHFPVDG